MFQIILSKKLSKKAKILAPISMRSKNFTPEKFKVLVDFLKPYNATLLIADNLQRYNFCGSEKDANKLGDVLLCKCKNDLKNALLIDSVESWKQNKNKNNLKIIRWSSWGTIKNQELKEGFRFIEALEKKSIEFTNSMQSVADNVAFQQAIISTRSCLDEESIKKNSILYQKEELAYMLTFSHFDVHLYPAINKSQCFLYDNFGEKFNIPKNIGFEIKINFGINFFDKKTNDFSFKKLSFESNQLFLISKNYLNSSEISIAEKKLFVELLLNEIEESHLNDALLESMNL